MSTSEAIGWTKDNSELVKKLFELDDVTMNNVEQNKSSLSIEKNQELMMVYLFECVLQLSLRPDNIISSNPSFELFNGHFAH